MSDEDRLQKLDEEHAKIQAGLDAARRERGVPPGERYYVQPGETELEELVNADKDNYNEWEGEVGLGQAPVPTQE